MPYGCRDTQSLFQFFLCAPPDPTGLICLLCAALRNSIFKGATFHAFRARLGRPTAVNVNSVSR
jgi:hypothetical protein